MLIFILNSAGFWNICYFNFPRAGACVKLLIEGSAQEKDTLTLICFLKMASRGVQCHIMYLSYYCNFCL